MKNKKKDLTQCALVNTEEYETLLACRYEAERLREENLRQYDTINDLKKQLGQSDESMITIKFQTFLNPSYRKDSWLYDDARNVILKNINAIQFCVDYKNGIVGYERKLVFEKLEELAEAMKKDLIEEFDKRYKGVIVSKNKEITKLEDDNREMKEAIKQHNSHHLFKVKYKDND